MLWFKCNTEVLASLQFFFLEGRREGGEKEREEGREGGREEGIGGQEVGGRREEDSLAFSLSLLPPI